MYKMLPLCKFWQIVVCSCLCLLFSQLHTNHYSVFTLYDEWRTPPWLTCGEQFDQINHPSIQTFNFRRKMCIECAFMSPCIICVSATSWKRGKTDRVSWKYVPNWNYLGNINLIDVLVALMSGKLLLTPGMLLGNQPMMTRFSFQPKGTVGTSRFSKNASDRRVTFLACLEKVSIETEIDSGQK